MRLIDFEPAIIEDLKSESELIAEKTLSEITVSTVRHPTLGRLVIIRLPNGAGMVVEIDE